MKLAIFLWGIILFSTNAFSQNINISILNKLSAKKITFVATEGKYDIISNNRITHTLQQGDSITIDIFKNSKIKISAGNKNIGKFKHVLLRGNKQSNYFTINHDANNTWKLAGSYDNDLNIFVEDSILKMINDVNFEKYIAGVVEAEGGPNAPIEYFKTQAILCRTYAIKHYDKHIREGYNLCDDVHCQAYKGRCKYNPAILQAAEETAGLVIVDKNLETISATFFANSGGETVNSEDVWVAAFPYLRGKVDKYSLNQPGYKWTKTISKDEWEKYLVQKGIKLPEGKRNYKFTQDKRTTIYTFNGQKLLLKNIRTDWGLRSTYFSIIDNNDGKLIFNGKGYGHGVGLSQEGAMEMARQNFTFDQIIKYYYTDVNITSTKAITFFQVE